MINTRRNLWGEFFKDLRDAFGKILCHPTVKGVEMLIFATDIMSEYGDDPFPIDLEELRNKLLAVELVSDDDEDEDDEDGYEDNYLKDAKLFGDGFSELYPIMNSMKIYSDSDSDTEAEGKLTLIIKWNFEYCKKIYYNFFMQNCGVYRTRHTNCCPLLVHLVSKTYKLLN